ncbi:alpha-amylase family glycosyl hydrolase [Rhodothermus profundi]|uniref:Por secretion system C-terminal sorting domain-containing protein n=1 Tax=Rhodothermus profundi TaxID=633813 RepID=A0A1M6RRB6_9BACT|nr:alpha-amylase family glycosyl hydrolase [Rhodothermus profundi]SHK34857.1 Por secretion system C-terminal sorting domain-containing protein [Rhodothermus profundi]
MRRLWFFALLLWNGVAIVRAQVVWTDPAVVRVDRPVTVYFNAKEGTGGLAGYTGDVYAHTGVITNESRTDTDWRYVKADWGENRADIRMERIGEDLYRLHIPDIRAYYQDYSGTPPSNAPPWDNIYDEQIRKLAFVFRNADGSREGKDVGGRDIFVDVAPPGVAVTFMAPGVSPLRPLIAPRDTSVEVVAVADPGAGAMLVAFRLLVNGQEVAQTTEDTLRYTLTLNAPGRFDVWAVAENTLGEVDTAAFYAVRNPPIVDQPRPPGIEDGITYDPNDPSRVTLSLYAPGKSFVYVIGDFTNWEVDPAYFMRRDAPRPDSVHWWITIEGLTPGQEYAFQYFIDGTLRLADPFAHKVLDPWHDPFIPASTYPDLKPYPTGKTEGIVAVLQPGASPYEWQVTDFERPPAHELVIYKLLVRDFIARHDYATLIDTLDYLERLGINAIELMPVAEFDGNISWGYNPAFHLAPDKYYGPASDLKRFIDECHRRGIAVILDVVYNHATGNSPLVQLYGPTPDNPFINIPARHPFNVFYDLNHEHPYIQYWLDRANRYWLEEFRVDGFRFDLSKGFTQKDTDNDVEAWSAYDASRIRLLKRMADAIWAVDSTAYIILEHFADNQEEKELAEHGQQRGRAGMLLWHNLNRAFSQSVMGYLNDPNFSSDLTTIYYKNRGFPTPNLVTYMESHDEQWLMYRMRAYGARRGAYDVRSLPVALDRMKLAGAFFFTVPGPKMIWQFSELGYGYGERGEQCLRGTGDSCPSIAPGRTDPKPIRWDYRNDPLRMKLYKTWAELLRLRREHAVFRSPETRVRMRLQHGRPGRWISLEHPELSAVVVGNFGLEPLVVTPTFPQTGTWYDYFNGDSLGVDNPETAIELLPGEFRLYTNRYIGRAEPGLITVGIAPDATPAPPTSLRLEAPFPNPFRTAVTVRYTLPAPAHVRVAIYDVLGRRIALLVDGLQSAGEHVTTWKPTTLAAGLYLVRLEAAGRSETYPLLFAP